MYRVFIADDEPLILEGIKVSVDWEAEGFFIVGAALNGLEAEKAILSLRPDLVLLDIRMPGQDGLSLIKRVRDAAPGAYFAIISGFADFEYAKLGIELGVIGYILKPVEERELLGIVRKAYGLLSGAAKAALASEGEPMLRDYIAAHFNDKLSLSMLVREMSMSPSTIQRKIALETGESFQRYLTRCRIDAAKAMLCDPAHLIGDIAKDCGFSDSLYFSRVFKRTVGVTPSEYRDNAREIEKIE